MILASMMTEAEVQALRLVAAYAPATYRPIYHAPISRTKGRQLAKLGLIDIRKGDIDGARIVRLSDLGRQVLASLPSSESTIVSKASEEIER